MPTTMTIEIIPSFTGQWITLDEHYCRIRKPWGSYSLERRMHPGRIGKSYVESMIEAIDSAFPEIPAYATGKA